MALWFGAGTPAAFPTKCWTDFLSRVGPIGPARPEKALEVPLDHSQTISLLGADAESLLSHTCTGIAKERLHLPGPDQVDRIWKDSDRNIQTLCSLQALFNHGRLGGTGYVSILPVDQGIEHAGGASFAKNPDYFDPANILELAVEGGCNGVATTYGVLGAVARKYAHKIPLILKLNHNELLTHPNTFDQIMFGQVEDAWNMGCVAVGATIYFGSPESNRQIVEVAEAFSRAHELGMATILWCYLRNPGFKVDGVDYHGASDLTSQANHLGVTIQADIIKQKLATNNGGYLALNAGDSSYGKLDKRIYSELCSEHPIDLVRYQVANCYMGRAGLINSGGASGENDLQQAVRTAVINKRGGGMGLISGRKAFQKPRNEGVALLNAIQDVYLDAQITVA
jgi:class I fructose-bisphosphate aldolase